MLYKGSDADTVRAWLSHVFELGAERGHTLVELARHCGVSPQAVSGWKRTGRISKSNLEKAVEYFGSAPSFTTAMIAREPEAAAQWPFKRVSHARFARLPAGEKHRIERQVEFMVEEWEAAKAEKAGKASKAQNAPKAPKRKRA
jgi:hypothetical protein